jgi:hypothetical protein
MQPTSTMQPVHLAMMLAAEPKLRFIRDDEHAVADFLAGADGGELVLHALWDHVLEETLPRRLLDEFRRRRRER